MKSKAIQVVTLFFFTFSLSLNAQTVADALRLTYFQQGNGTARSMGVGGALGALGADYSAVGVNPAGLASFRTSEFMFSAGYTSVNTDALLRNAEKPNEVYADTKAKFYLNNIGFVGSRRPTSGNWRTKNWAVGLNRTATFDASFYFVGKTKGSIVNRFLEKGNNNLINNDGHLGRFEDSLAYETGAIYPENLEFTSDFEKAGKNIAIDKGQQGITEGKVNELMLGYAANYKEKIQIGATIGIPFMRLNDNKLYEESDIQTLSDPGNIPAFKALEFRENLGVEGRGINAKLGIILKPSQYFRVGAALQTPNRYKFSETFNTSMSYTFREKGLNEVTIEAESPDLDNNYVIRTPWRFTGSAAILVGKKGFVSADVEYLDYSKMAFEFGLDDKDFENDINRSIKSSYTSAVNIRLGAEATMDIFRFRVGLATLGLPTRVDNPDYWRDAAKTYSFGAGLRENRFYLDVAYQFTRTSEEYKPYRVSIDYEQPRADITQNRSQVVATMGFKF